MGHMLAVGFVVCLTVGVATSDQGALGGVVTPNQWKAASDLTVAMTCSQSPCGSTSIVVSRTEPYVDGPRGFLGAGRPLLGASEPERAFSIRAWKEGDKARVVVSASMLDQRSPDGRTETPIATFTIVPGQSVDVRESERWGGPRYLVTATR